MIVGGWEIALSNLNKVMYPQTGFTKGQVIEYYREMAPYLLPHLKEQEDPIPLCYCFGYTRENVRSDIEEHGATEIPERIKAEVQGGFCACEVKNPSGDCCLGNVVKAIQEVRNKLAHAATRS